MLQATDLTRRVGKRRILDQVSFSIEQGQTATLLGPSGSGKTSLLRMIMGLDRPDSGELSFAGKTLVAPGQFVAPEQRGISLVFQEFTLFPHLNVSDNLRFGLVRPDAGEGSIDELLDWKLPICANAVSIACPAVNSSGWRWPAPWSLNRQYC